MPKPGDIVRFTDKAYVNYYAPDGWEGWACVVLSQRPTGGFVLRGIMPGQLFGNNEFFGQKEIQVDRFLTEVYATKKTQAR